MTPSRGISSCISSASASPATSFTGSADSMDAIEGEDSIEGVDSIEAFESSLRLGRGRGSTPPFFILSTPSFALRSAAFPPPLRSRLLGRAVRDPPLQASFVVEGGFEPRLRVVYQPRFERVEVVVQDLLEGVAEIVLHLAHQESLLVQVFVHHWQVGDATDHVLIEELAA